MNESWQNKSGAEQSRAEEEGWRRQMSTNEQQGNNWCELPVLEIGKKKKSYCSLRCLALIERE